MIWLVGTVTKVNGRGCVVDVGEGRSCNVWVSYQDGKRYDVKAGDRVRVMCTASWRKKTDHEQEAEYFQLSLTALDITKK